MPIELSDNLHIKIAKGTEKRNGPFSSVSSAVSSIPLGERTAVVTVWIGSPGSEVPYRWKLGTADNQLIPEAVTVNSNTAPLDSVKVVFYHASNSIPTVTTTDIDGQTVQDGWRVLDLTDGYIKLASVSGQNITWTNQDGGPGANGQEGNLTWSELGNNYVDTWFTWDGSSWIGNQVTANVLPNTEHITRSLRGVIGAFGWSEDLISVTHSFDTSANYASAAASIGVGEATFVEENRTIYYKLQLDNGTALSTGLVLSEGYTVLAMNSLIYYQWNGSTLNSYQLTRFQITAGVENGGYDTLTAVTVPFYFPKASTFTTYVKSTGVTSFRYELNQSGTWVSEPTGHVSIPAASWVRIELTFASAGDSGAVHITGYEN